MSAQKLAPRYIPQYVPRLAEQRQIIAEATEVSRSRQSRAVLLYGRGGIGKTRLVRQLPEIARGSQFVWLDPVDVDDSQQWLLSNLEGFIAGQLDRDNRYFGQYHEYVSELPRHRLMAASRQMALDHLNRVKEVFTECYLSYIQETGNTVVITFDTVEVIRDMYLLRTLTRWMKALPGTLFILAGRPQRDSRAGQDPIIAAIEDHPSPMPVTVVPLGEFEAADCREYLALLSRDTDLTDDEMDKFVYLTQGHPLWLAFTVDYLTQVGLPDEARAPLEEIKADLPYHDEPGSAGVERADSFKRRLVAPYREGGFWHEAIKRLAVVRESVSEPIWLKLMSDRPLPDDALEPGRAWARLTAMEWIRLRANNRYVTLHDAVAEELAQRIIDLHDPDQRWRQQLWRSAARIYAAEVAELETRLTQLQSSVDRRLAAVNAPHLRRTSQPVVTEADLMRDVAELNRWQQELNQLKAAQLIYQLLSDFQEGAGQFVTMMRQARRDHDVLFEDLLAFQMQRFLPGGPGESASRDAVGGAIEAFRHWLRRNGQASYAEIGLEMATYLNDREQHEAALGLLGELRPPADHKMSYRIRRQQGNACMRIPSRVGEAGDHFQAALREANQVPSADRYRYVSDAYKELGFYYRNMGQWQNADKAYENARDAIAQALRQGSPDVDREEMASINTNWAYVKAIGGKHDDAINLVDSAITVRSRIGRRHEQAISCSVRGEVYRYHRQFKEAWDAYEEAVELFGETSRSWLGVVYQEQAICLFQSIPAGVRLIDPPADPTERAESLILESLDLCRVFNVRNYPAALNRAGRIFAAKDVDLGLGYLEEAAERAQQISDGWFWLASLIEHAELCYRAWAGGQRPEYRERIKATGVKLQEAGAPDLDFRELRGRWQLLQGHLAIHDALAGDDTMLEAALKNYMDGFPLILHGWVGSYGASVIPTEFRKFRDLVWQLPDDTRAHWQTELYRSWSNEEAASATQLLARLEELY